MARKIQGAVGSGEVTIKGGSVNTKEVTVKVSWQIDPLRITRRTFHAFSITYSHTGDWDVVISNCTAEWKIWSPLHNEWVLPHEARVLRGYSQLPKMWKLTEETTYRIGQKLPATAGMNNRGLRETIRDAIELGIVSRHSNALQSSKTVVKTAIVAKVEELLTQHFPQ